MARGEERCLLGACSSKGMFATLSVRSRPMQVSRSTAVGSRLSVIRALHHAHAQPRCYRPCLQRVDGDVARD